MGPGGIGQGGNLNDNGPPASMMPSQMSNGELVTQTLSNGPKCGVNHAPRHADVAACSCERRRLVLPLAAVACVCVCDARLLVSPIILADDAAVVMFALCL